MKKVVIGFIIGAITFSGIGVLAANYLAKDITYNKNGQATVEAALNDLYNKKNNSLESVYWNFPYTGEEQEFIVPATGKYKVELWGAQGGSAIEIANDGWDTNAKGGKGSYTSGIITFNKNEKYYIYVGGEGKNGNYASTSTTIEGGYNGGGAGLVARTTCYQQNGSGGGATDIRLVGGTWDNVTGLNSRIMVASGGGGSYQNNCSSSDKFQGNAYDGGGTGNSSYPSNGFQTHGGYGRTEVGGAYNSTTVNNGGFGIGGSGTKVHGGGGGGYYGGGGGFWWVGGSGSSYISGHKGSIAITSVSNRTAKCDEPATDESCSYHYSNKKFTESIMISGSGYKWTTERAATPDGQPQPDGTTKNGHEGNGYARITYLGN